MIKNLYDNKLIVESRKNDIINYHAEKPEKGLRPL